MGSTVRSCLKSLTVIKITRYTNKPHLRGLHITHAGGVCKGCSEFIRPYYRFSDSFLTTNIARC